MKIKSTNWAIKICVSCVSNNQSTTTTHVQNTRTFEVYARNEKKRNERKFYLVDLSSNRMVRCVRSMEFCQVKCSFWVCRMSLGAIRSAIVRRAVTTSVSMFPSYEIDPHASYYYQNLSFFLTLYNSLSLCVCVCQFCIGLLMFDLARRKKKKRTTRKKTEENPKNKLN